MSLITKSHQQAYLYNTAYKKQAATIENTEAIKDLY